MQQVNKVKNTVNNTVNNTTIIDNKNNNRI